MRLVKGSPPVRAVKGEAAGGREVGPFLKSNGGAGSWTGGKGGGGGGAARGAGGREGAWRPRATPWAGC